MPTGVGHIDPDKIEQTYIPSCKVTFSIRLEEFTQKRLESQLPELKVSPTFKGTAKPRGGMVSQEIELDTDLPHVRRFVVHTGDPNARPTSPTVSADNLTFDIGGVVPRSLTLKRNGVRKGDECDIEIKWNDMPFDPRIMRAIAVEVYLGTVTPENHAAGVNGATRTVSRRAGQALQEPTNMVPDVDSSGRSNLRFQGWVDEVEDDRPGGGAAVVKLKCIDNTRLFLSQTMPTNMRPDMKTPVDEMIAKFLCTFPQLDGMAVEYRGDPEDSETFIPPTLATVTGKYFKPEDIGFLAGKGGGATSGGGFTVWDYVVSVCTAASLACWVQGSTLVLQRPSILLGRNQRRPDEQYQTRQLNYEDFPFRAFVYGRNVKDVNFKRSYAKRQARNIQVQSYDPSRKNMLIARYPADLKKLASSANPGDGKVDAKWTVVQLDEIRDQKSLDRAAKDLYHLYGRWEMEVNIKTRNLSSYGGGNDDPDLFDLHEGDTIQYLVARDEHGTSSILAAEDALRSESKAGDLLGSIGYDPKVAGMVAAAYNDAGFQEYFKVKEAQIQWGLESGVDISLRAVNFVELRLDDAAVGDVGITTKY